MQPASIHPKVRRQMSNGRFDRLIAVANNFPIAQLHVNELDLDALGVPALD